MAQLPLASAGLFLDIAHAHPSATETVDSDTANSVLENNIEPVITPVEKSSLKLGSDEIVSTKTPLHPLLEPLASLSENISSKFPLIQPYRVGEKASSQENAVASIFPLTANYLPSQIPPRLDNANTSVETLTPVEAEVEPIEIESIEKVSEWRSLPNNTLKQWRQPSIEVISVNVKELGRSLQPSAPVSGLKQAIAKAFPKNKVAEAPTPDWHAFCFSAAMPKPDPKMVKQVHQLVINQQVVAEFATVAQANLMAKRLRSWIQEKMFSPSALVAKVKENKVLGLTQDKVLFEVDQAVSELLGQNRDTIAIAWVNNLRTALNVNPVNLVDAQTQLYGLTASSETMDGTASWYGPYFHGRQTASGEYFHEGELTVAHKSLPFNTFLKVTNLDNDQSVIVRVNDRGPYIGERSLDLSRNAAQCLGSEEDGVIPYQAVIMKPGT